MKLLSSSFTILTELCQSRQQWGMLFTLVIPLSSDQMKEAMPCLSQKLTEMEDETMEVCYSGQGFLFTQTEEEMLKIYDELDGSKINVSIVDPDGNFKYENNPI